MEQARMWLKQTIDSELGSEYHYDYEPTNLKEVHKLLDYYRLSINLTSGNPF